MHVCVTAVGSFTVRPRGFPQFRQVQNSEYVHGVRKTLTSCQQNPILFGRARLTTPTRLGFLFQLTFPVTSRRNGNYDSNTKCKGCRHGPNDSSRCWLHHDSDTINSIITQKQLYLTRKTVRTSERFRESTQLDKHGWRFNCRLVAKEQHPNPGGTFYRSSWRHCGMRWWHVLCHDASNVILNIWTDVVGTASINHAY